MENYLIKQIYHSEIKEIFEHISLTKPNFHSLWKRFYDEKEKKYIDSLKNIIESLKKIELHHCDIETESIDFLYLLYFSSMYSQNTRE